MKKELCIECKKEKMEVWPTDQGGAKKEKEGICRKCYETRNRE